jgi:Fis family transcriptional regulator, factor for inversion stimulation protein
VRELLDRLVDQMVSGGIQLQEGRDEFDRRFIQRVLLDTDGHLSQAAARLGIHRNTLTRRLAELDLTPRGTGPRGRRRRRATT